MSKTQASKQHANRVTDSTQAPRRTAGCTARTAHHDDHQLKGQPDGPCDVSSQAGVGGSQAAAVGAHHQQQRAGKQ